MGKSKEKYVIISGLNLHDNNRGTAALGYGSISFLAQRHGLTPETKIIRLQYVKKFWKKKYRERHEQVKQGGNVWDIFTVSVFVLEKWLLHKSGIILPFTRFSHIMRNLEYVAAINGGDGFSDIYNTRTFFSRLPETLLAMRVGSPVIQLPQTLGPFKEHSNYEIAKDILQYSKNVYVRDDKFVDELEKMHVKYELTNDLSAYMEPESFNIYIAPDSVGLNISGLAYSNTFRTLSGQFDNYPCLCKRIVQQFQMMDKHVYLISHSYNYQSPEDSNDDMVAAREFYANLENKDGVYLIDQDLTSPQTKYLISQMSYFIGTRMHANFAAIFTKTPVFGLAYSYKFEGAFNNNGLFGQTAMVNNITKDQVDEIVDQIMKVYYKYMSK